MNSKWVVKQRRQLAFGPGAANERAAQWGVREFCIKAHSSLDMSLDAEERGGRPSEADKGQLSDSRL